jgi:hypothetical protein
VVVSPRRTSASRTYSCDAELPAIAGLEAYPHEMTCKLDSNNKRFNLSSSSFSRDTDACNISKPRLNELYLHDVAMLGTKPTQRPDTSGSVPQKARPLCESRTV